MFSSDIEICHGAHAGVQCDGEVITIQYVVNGEPIGNAWVYTRLVPQVRVLLLDANLG